ncbi:NmrA family NAD(P)-binding protein [Streptomyces bottropensis]|uniref:NmrA family NAD(P)-binding protein n=1 Tax=Streptomyces bottropensis TaxID=42235 RepID=UPI0037A54549
MSPHATSTIFVIGGTGAQGIPVVRALVADKKYSVRLLTRDATSPPSPGTPRARKRLDPRRFVRRRGRTARRIPWL